MATILKAPAVVLVLDVSGARVPVISFQGFCFSAAQDGRVVLSSGIRWTALILNEGHSSVMNVAASSGGVGAPVRRRCSAPLLNFFILVSPSAARRAAAAEDWNDSWICLDRLWSLINTD